MTDGDGKKGGVGRFGADAQPVRPPAERDVEHEREERLRLLEHRPRRVRVALGAGAVVIVIVLVLLIGGRAMAAGRGPQPGSRPQGLVGVASTPAAAGFGDRIGPRRQRHILNGPAPRAPTDLAGRGD